jgi:hypothetical protein
MRAMHHVTAIALLDELGTLFSVQYCDSTVGRLNPLRMSAPQFHDMIPEGLTTQPDGSPWSPAANYTDLWLSPHA